MCETLAQHMADEWWFKIRERIGKYQHPVNNCTRMMIEQDLINSNSCAWQDADDIAGTACEILKQRVKQETNSIMAEGIERWETSESK